MNNKYVSGVGIFLFLFLEVIFLIVITSYVQFILYFFGIPATSKYFFGVFLTIGLLKNLYKMHLKNISND